MSDIISINSGVVRKTLETTDGKTCELAFNATDSAFVEKLFNAFDTLDKKQEKHTLDLEKMTTRETFDCLKQLDREMRDTIDGVFGQPVCEPLFGSMSVYASAGGTPVWMNLMLAIIDELDEGVKREKAFHSEKLAKYTKKYHR